MLWPCLFALIIAFFYSLIVYLRARQDFVGWCHALVAGIVSILLGISVGFFLFSSQQRMSDDAARQRYLNLVRLELSGVKRSLTDQTDKANISTALGERSIHVTYIQPVVLEEAGKSGLFQESQSFMMLDLSGSMRMFNRKTGILLDLLSSCKEPLGLAKNVDAAIENIERSRKGILTGIDLLSKNLKIELADNIKVYK